MSHIDLGFTYDIGSHFPGSGVAYSVWSDPSAWTGNGYTLSYSRPADNGVRVTPLTAMYSAAVWQGLNIIAGDCGMMPIELMRRNGREVHKQRTHAGAKVLRRPHTLLRGGDFRELMQMRAILYGNAVAEITRDGGGRPMMLTPLPSDHTYIEYDEKGQLWYHTRVDDKDRMLRPEDVLHITSLSTNGLWGLPLVVVAKNVIGDDLGLQMFANRSFANGAVPGGYIKVQGRMSPDDRADLRDDWQTVHGGLFRANTLGVLDSGKEFVPIPATHEQAQMVEARKFAVEQVSRVLLIPSFKLNALDRATFNNIEEMQRQYLVSLQRWLTKWIDECEAKLLTERQIDTGDWYFHWDTSRLIQADAKTSAEVDQLLIASRIKNPNEARVDRGWNPYEGGDAFENPNTSSGKADKKEEESAEDEPQRDAMAMRLLANELKQLTHTESEQIRRAAKKPSHFVDWLDNFYTVVMPERMSWLVTSDVATTYCEERKTAVLEMCECDSTELVSRAERDSERHIERTKQLINMEMKS